MNFLLAITCFMALKVTSSRAGLINAPDSGVRPWRSRNIPYKWLGKDVGEIAMLKDAMAQISLDTGYCVNFTDITASSSPDKAYLQIKPVDPVTTMCYSRAGYAGDQSVAARRPQTMVAFSSRTGNPVGACLDSKREAMRLLTRVLGVMDEFRKPSRNTVMTFPEGFQPGFEQLNLLSRYVEHYDIFGVERVDEEYPDAVDATPGVFDALSVTMISGTRYAADPKKPVFTVAGNVKVGDLARLSLLDCKTVTKLYGCSSAVCVDPYTSGISVTVPPMPRPTSPAPAGTNKKQQVVDFLKAFETGAQEPLSVINPNKFIEHDPTGFDGLAGIKGLQKALNGTARVNTVRVFQDGDYVFTHTDYDFFGPKFAFDILRFEGDFIVEHWDNLQTKPTQPNPSGHTMIDGPTQARTVPVSETSSNKAMVRKILQEHFIEGQPRTMSDFYDVNFIQHNPLFADGLKGMTAGYNAQKALGKTWEYKKIYLVLGDGDFVLTQSEGIQGDKPVAIYDLFRLQNGKIAEHWDVLQNIPPASQFNNKNGKFGEIPSSKTRKQKTVEFLKAFETGAQEPLSVINPNKFIEHDPTGFDGLAGVKGLQKALNGTARVNTVRVFQDGDYVFTHTDYDFFGPKFAFDILRFEGDFIVEHWDNLQAKPTQPNPSGHTMIDGPTQPESNVPISVVCSNKEAVRKFLESVFVNGHIDWLEYYLDFSEGVVQHNPLMGDGLMGWLNGTRTAAKEGRSVKYTRVHLVLGDGNFVLAQSEGLQAVQPVAIYDLFRLKNGRIAEHWDVIQEIPPAEKFNHKNGKF